MAMVGNSRPASGSEHHFSHYWEMLGLKESKPLPLHGQKVGFAAYLILKIYEKVIARVKSGQDQELKQAFAPIEDILIGSEEYLNLLTKADALRTYQDLGLPREWVEGALLNAMYVRDRYTILRFVADKGWLTEIAAEIMTEIDPTPEASASNW